MLDSGKTLNVLVSSMISVDLSSDDQMMKLYTILYFSRGNSKTMEMAMNRLVHYRQTGILIDVTFVRYWRFFSPDSARITRQNG